MGWKFNPAPGWPDPPEGFVPEAGWNPDPSWPPAPADWIFWVDDGTSELTTPATDQAVTLTPTAPIEAVPTGLTADKPGWRERRAERHASKEHARAVADWQAEQDALDGIRDVARAAATGNAGIATSIIVKNGETALWDGQARLIEPRRQPGEYTGGYSGFSFRIAKGVRYNVGGTRGHYVPGPEVQTPVDSGRAAVTTTRVVFTGAKATREWAFGKLVSIDASSDSHAVLIHVSNRQKVSGLFLGGGGHNFTRLLALGVAISQNGAAAVAAECEAAATSHQAERP